jgi:hypothetical protein
MEEEKGFVIRLVVDGEGDGTSTSNIESEENDNKSTFSDFLHSKKTKQVGIALANTAVQFGKYMYEQNLDKLGATSTQKTLQNVKTAANDVISLGMGFAYGGWVGLAVSAIYVAASYGYSFYSNSVNVNKQNQSINYSYNATGNASLLGSRYTND